MLFAVATKQCTFKDELIRRVSFVGFYILLSLSIHTGALSLVLSSMPRILAKSPVVCQTDHL